MVSQVPLTPTSPVSFSHTKQTSYLVGPVLLVVSQELQTGTQRHQRLVDVACLLQAIASVARAVGALTSRQVHQRELTDADLVHVLGGRVRKHWFSFPKTSFTRCEDKKDDAAVPYFQTVFFRAVLIPSPMSVCVCVVNVIVKHLVLPPCAVDGRYTYPHYYY